MQYFNTLPKILYTDENGNSSVRVNILARAKIIPEILKNPLLYYTYDIQEGDTPEIVAHKYYGNSYRYWIVLFSNEALDPQWNWPLSNQQFSRYLNEKYANTNIYSTVHHYEKIITQTDFVTDTVTVSKLSIDQNTYISLTESTNTYSLPTGNVKVDVTKTAVSIFDYENDLNESKRNIRLLNAAYVSQLENEFEKLMRKQYV